MKRLKRLKRKRPFFLFEVLIALSLVIMCALPLILKPIRIYRSEMQSLEELERERMADWTFSEIKELLLKNEIPWGKLPALHEKSDPFPLDDGFIHVPGRKKKKIERSFTLFGKGEKLGEEEKIYRMLYVSIQFDPPLEKGKNKIYTYRLVVQRISKQIYSTST